MNGSEQTGESPPVAIEALMWKATFSFRSVTTEAVISKLCVDVHGVCVYGRYYLELRVTSLGLRSLGGERRHYIILMRIESFMPLFSNPFFSIVLKWKKAQFYH